MREDGAEQPNGRKKTGKVFKVVSTVGGAILLLFIGINIGNGTIYFGPTNSANKELPADLDYSSVEQVYDLLRRNYDGKLNETKLLDGLKKGLAEASGDPYTQFFDKKSAKEFDDQLNGSFSGIGAQLGKDDQDNLIVVSPIDGFPASKAGLRSKDIIVSVDNASTHDMSIDEAVSKIRGEKGTKVTLRILRNKSEDLSFTITREDIHLPSVKWEMLEGRVGYIQVAQFGTDTSELMLQASQELKAKGADRVILDLRDNPGGSLSVAVDMASLWLPEGKIILTEKRGGITTKEYKATGPTAFQDMPTVVLINAGSASASEIVAGALKDNKAATLVGEKSYGKGSVQDVISRPGGEKVKITIARWQRPNGENIDKKGIKPDTEVKMTEEDYKQDRDPQKARALEQLSR